MARRKKANKAAGGKRDGRLENLLRFEVVVVLFSLIGLYYFLSFSPVRMPANPVRSPRQVLGPLSVVKGSLDEAAEPETAAVNRAPAETEPSSPADIDGDAAETVLPEKSVALDGDPGSNQVSGQPAGSDDNGSRVSEKKATKATEEPVKEPPSTVDDQVPAADKVQDNSAVATPDASPASNRTALSDVPKAVPAASPGRKTSPSLKAKPRRRSIEVGAYVLDSEVRSAEDKLQALGLPFTTNKEKRPTPMYRVFLGPFASASSIEEALAAARRLGDQPFLHRDNDRTLVVIGSFYLQSSVVAWENLYHDAGLDPQVEKEIISLPRTVLRIEERVFLHEATEALLEKLRTAGFSDARLVDKEK